MKLDKEDKILIVKKFGSYLKEYLPEDRGVLNFFSFLLFFHFFMVILINIISATFLSILFLLIFMISPLVIFCRLIYRYRERFIYVKDYNYGVSKKTNAPWIKMNVKKTKQRKGFVFYLDSKDGSNTIALPDFINWEKYNQSKIREQTIDSLL